MKKLKAERMANFRVALTEAFKSFNKVRKCLCKSKNWIILCFSQMQQYWFLNSSGTWCHIPDDRCLTSEGAWWSCIQGSNVKKKKSHLNWTLGLWNWDHHTVSNTLGTIHSLTWCHTPGKQRLHMHHCESQRTCNRIFQYICCCAFYCGHTVIRRANILQWKNKLWKIYSKFLQIYEEVIST